jgi:hypothetical protein
VSNLILSLLFDLGLAVLLIATIVYCSKLSTRIRLLQNSRGEMAEMIAQFDSATDRATTSLGELQTVSKKITDALQLKIDKANFLADDLAFLIEKSTKLATQLEQAKAARVSEALTPVKTKPAFESKPQFDIGSFSMKPRTTASKPDAQPTGPAPDAAATARNVSSLEAVLQRLSSGTGSAASTLSSDKFQGDEPSPGRTNAERELLEALKASR